MVVEVGASSSSPMTQIPATPVDNDVNDPAKTIKEQHARKTVLEDLSQNSSIRSGVEHDADTCACALTRVSRNTRVSYERNVSKFRKLLDENNTLKKRSSGNANTKSKKQSENDV